MAIAYARYQTHASAQRGVNAPVGSLMAMAKRGYLGRRWHYAGLGNGVGPRLLGWIFGGLPQQRARLDAAIFHLDGRRPGRLLDVGCGAGDAIERMSALGWRAEGVDTDPAAVAVARNRGLTVHEGTLDRLRLEPESFDAVTLSHVIEHVPDPRALLGECRRLLTPGGALFIETPNARSWLHARFGRHWRGLEPPRHFQVFTPASLARLVAGQDLQVSHLATSSKAASFTFAASRAAAHAERRGVPSCDAFGAGLRRAGAMAAAAEWTLGWVAKDRGEEIVVFATRAGPVRMTPGSTAPADPAPRETGHAAASPPAQPPGVTIVIPTYKQADSLEAAITSALAQSHPRLEVLVMDDASPDTTPEITSRWASDPRVRVIRNPSNLGRVANYRAGLDQARGDWVLVLDGDDVLTDPGFVAAAVAAAERDVVLVVGGQRFRDMEDGRYRDRFPTTRERETVDGWRFFLRWTSPQQVVPHLGSLYRADMARAAGFYRLDILSSDWESMRRLCLRGRVVLLRRLAGEWRGHERNVSRRLDPDLHLDNLAAILAPYDDAIQSGRSGARLLWWKWDALQRSVARYLEAALTQGDTPAARAFVRGLGDRLGRAPAALLVGFCCISRPSLWVKTLLRAAGGPSLLARARRVWHRWTWSRR